jgi:hypothetical protein
MLNSRSVPAVLAATALIVAMGSAQAAPRQILRNHVPQAVNQSRRLGPLSPQARLNLAIGLPLRNSENLNLFVEQVADPTSPAYRQYLSAPEFAERFGPTEKDYNALIGFFRANGFVISGTHANRMILDVSGPVSAIEQTFHVTMTAWQHPRRGQFFAPDRDPSVEADVELLDVSGLDNFALPAPMDMNLTPLNSVTPMVTGSGPYSLFIGKDFRAAYAPGVTLTGAAQTIGLIEFDGYYAADLTANFKQAGLPVVPAQTVLLDGFNGAPGSGNIEVILDIVMAGYMAPGSSVLVYEGLTPNDVLNRAATDNTARQISCSWTFSPINATTEQIFKEMIAQGQSFLQASGDSGKYTGAIMPPADDPNVTVVGGTALTTTGPGGAWLSETAWSGSGGGVSTTYAIPTYQQGTNVTAAGGSNSMRNIPDVAMLAAPEIFLIANNGIGYEVGGTSAAAPLWAGFTSLANQQAASSQKAAAGFLNPALYTIGNGSHDSSDLHDITTGSNGASAIAGYDLATGWGTPAGQSLINDLISLPGAASFTLTTSAAVVSSPLGASTTAAIQVNAQNGFSGAVKLTASGLPNGVTATFGTTSASGATVLTLAVSNAAVPGSYSISVQGASGGLNASVGLTLQVLGTPGFSLTASVSPIVVNPGGSNADSITVVPVNGFTSAVALTVTGLPAGVTASFSPASATTTSALTFTAGASASLGNTTVTVTGKSANLTETVTITLTVALPPPSFTLTAAASAVSMAPGAGATDLITVTPKNGFSGTVAFSVVGLPSGVTVSFSPATTATSSTATFSAAAAATPGTYTAIVTGASGALGSLVTVSVTVKAPPSFTLAASPASLNVNQGASGASTITVSALGGFTGSPTLAASGLPAGVTASFSAGTAASTSTVTFSAAPTAPPGTSTVTVTGTWGVLSASTTISLTVKATPTFTLAASPASLSVTQGTSGTSTVTVTSLNGFNGSPTLAAGGLQSGVTASFSPATTSTTSTVTLTASATAAPGTTTVTVTGASGAISAFAAISLTVKAAPAFTLAASPPALLLTQGMSQTSVITVTPLNGFTGAATFAASGLPSGVTASFAPAASATGSTLTLTASSSAAPQIATITVKGTAGAVSASTTISLTVTVAPSFTLSAAPASLSLTQGSSGTSIVTAIPQNGFTGLPTLLASGLPTGVTASYGANFVMLTASPTAAQGTSTVTVTGTSGALSASTSIGLTIKAAPSFTLSASPASLTITQGTSGTSSITVNPLNGFTASPILLVSGLPTGVTASFSPQTTATSTTLTLSAAASAGPSVFTVAVTGISGTLSAWTTLSVTVKAASSFVLGASPASLSITQGASGTATITVTPQNGFTGTPTFAANGLPSGVTASFGAGAVTFTASPTAAPGTSTVTVKGASGTLSESVTLSLTVKAAPSFILGASPASLNITQGASGSTTITVIPANGFSGSTTLAATGLPNGVTASFSPSSTATTSKLTLTASASAAVVPATVTIAATSGSLTAQTTVAVTIAAAPSFKLTATAANVNIYAGGSAVAVVTISPQAGFASTVSLTISGLPTGVTAAFSPATATTSATLNLSAASSAHLGAATITVTGTSGAIASSTTFTLTVLAATH